MAIESNERLNMSGTHIEMNSRKRDVLSCIENDDLPHKKQKTVKEKGMLVYHDCHKLINEF